MISNHTNNESPSLARIPGYPNPWAYRKDVADALIELRYLTEIKEAWPSDALEIFTYDLFEAFHSRPVHASDLLCHARSGGSSFAEILQGCEQDYGPLGSVLEGWLELNKGVERDGKVLVRVGGGVAKWCVIDLEFPCCFEWPDHELGALEG